ncbi:Hypothetical predicted protein [Lecanosticta acicola]|uniref:Uncharacterized protein n=1 Tax=Lecanosticta acicola TaxID=111012 RepID=A0AAI8YZZ0_9PEZI|nr:Hypothetical predicted protein [Lecanosticta acicola]
MKSSAAAEGVQTMDGNPPVYTATATSAVQSKAFTLELIHCAPKGLSASGAVLTGRVINTLTDIVSITSTTTHRAFTDLCLSRGEIRSKTRDVFPEAENGEGNHMVIRLQLGEKSILVDEASWADVRSLVLGEGEASRDVCFKCYYAKTPAGWEKRARRFQRPGGSKRERKCIVM